MSDTDLSSRIRQRREQLGLSQEELAARMGYRSKSSITKLEKGINDLPRAKLEELAAALDTTPAWLMGLVDLPCPPPGFEPLPEMVRVPLVGSIACGTPITAEQNIECYIGVPAAWHADFALTCHGSSMAPTICDGDIVCIRRQPEGEQDAPQAQPEQTADPLLTELEALKDQAAQQEPPSSTSTARARQSCCWPTTPPSARPWYSQVPSWKKFKSRAVPWASAVAYNKEESPCLHPKK